MRLWVITVKMAELKTILQIAIVTGVIKAKLEKTYKLLTSFDSQKIVSDNQYKIISPDKSRISWDEARKTIKSRWVNATAA